MGDKMIDFRRDREYIDIEKNDDLLDCKGSSYSINHHIEFPYESSGRLLGHVDAKSRGFGLYVVEDCFHLCEDEFLTRKERFYGEKNADEAANWRARDMAVMFADLLGIDEIVDRTL
jgi:hypothetical protein